MSKHIHSLNPGECINYYCNQQFGRGSYFSSPIAIQRGYGFLGNLGRIAIPILMKAGKYFGKHLMSTGRKVIQDVSQGKSLRDASHERIRETGKEIKHDILRKLKGGGVSNKRKRNAKKTQSKRQKQSVKDVFDRE